MAEQAFDPSKIILPEKVLESLALEAEKAIRSLEGQAIFYILDGLKMYPLKKTQPDAPAKAGRTPKAETNGTAGVAL